MLKREPDRFVAKYTAIFLIAVYVFLALWAIILSAFDPILSSFISTRYFLVSVLILVAVIVFYLSKVIHCYGKLSTGECLLELERFRESRPRKYYIAISIPYISVALFFLSIVFGMMRNEVI